MTAAEKAKVAERLLRAAALVHNLAVQIQSRLPCVFLVDGQTRRMTVTPDFVLLVWPAGLNRVLAAFSDGQNAIKFRAPDGEDCIVFISVTDLPKGEAIPVAV